MTDGAELLGYTVGVTAARRAWEFGTALEHRGARIVYAPAMRIVPPAEDPALHDATKQCVAGPIDVLVATNPVGLRAWFEAADGWGLGDALRGALGAAAVVGRGPRVAQAARAVGLGAAWTPPTDSVTDTIEHLMRAGVSGRRVAVAQHGEPPPDLARALRCAGADVIEVIAFGWTPPRDPRPLEKLVAATAGGHVDVLAFTSAAAATSFLRAADEFGRRDELAHALRQRVLVACIGPVTAEPWRRADLPVVVAGRPRLRTLVREIADRTQHRCGRVVSAVGHRLDVRGHLVVVDTVPIAPGAEAMALCVALSRHPGQVLSLAELRAALPIDPGADRVAAIMATLGTTLGDSRIVQTLGANGYRLAADVDHGTGCRHDGTGTRRVAAAGRRSRRPRLSGASRLGMIGAMSHQVRGMVSHAKGEPVRIETVLVPDPGPGEALVRVQACGVCHTDLHYREGGITDDFPFLLGHEASGVVEQVGAGVTDISPGDFVVLNWRAVCGHCRACLRAEPWYCFDTHNARQQMTLADGQPLSPALGIGAFVEKTLVHAGQCTPVDPAVAPAVAGLLGCGVMAGLGAALNTGGVRRGQHVAVIGCGGVGCAAIAGARLAGAARIIAVDIDDRKLASAVRLGATHTVNSRQADPVTSIRELTDGFGADVVIDAVGRPETYEQAFYARDLAGTVVLVGVPTPDMRLDLPLLDVFGRGGALKSSWYGDCLPSRDFPLLIDLHLQGRLPLDAFVSETIGLDDVEEAFAAMGRGDVLRSVVLF